MSNLINKPSIGFWIISVVALIWNAMGVNAYMQQVYQTDSFKAAYSVEQLEIMSKAPSWYTAVFATAVFASFLGCIFLLMRRKIAVTLFKLGLLVVLIQAAYNLFINEAKDSYGAFEYSMIIMIVVAAIFLVWFSKNATEKGLLS